MLRAWLRAVVGIALTTTITTPPALAAHDALKNPPGGLHVPLPTNVLAITTVKASCLVTGIVTIDDQFGTGGVSLTEHNHNHYNFVDADITCVDTNPLDQDYGGTYDVFADGGTDGCLPTAMATNDFNNCTSLKSTGMVPGHGEWAGLGWSHMSGYNDNSINTNNAVNPELDVAWMGPGTCDPVKPTNQTGDIHIERPAGDIVPNKWADGWVKFVRVGVEIHAWGCLDWQNDAKKQDFVDALLVFAADPSDPENTDNLINNATVIGTAVIGN